MTVVVSLLRGVNVGGNHKIKMEQLRALYQSLGLLDAQTLLQSGNVVFRTQERDLLRLARKIEDGIEKTFGFRAAIVLRTSAELRDAISRNPFVGRAGMEPSKLLVTFLADHPPSEIRDKLLAIKAEPDELHHDGREMFMYFPDGMAKAKLPLPAIDRMLKASGTGRNWNTVMKLLQIAEMLEALPQNYSPEDSAPR